jgi:hypothetical protein
MTIPSLGLVIPDCRRTRSNQLGPSQARYVSPTNVSKLFDQKAGGRTLH